MSTKHNNIFLVFIAIIVFIVGGFIFWKYKSNKKLTPPPASSGLEQTVASSVTQGVLPSLNNSLTPLQNQPNLNPIQTANPFTTIKTNPFK
ncbi:MAG: hypothetical protein KGI50_01690 [Patescibacteria group bacterium]|nr:hypothetical protein [Patescibacteria group bacterium]MDE2437944.1 hypothetical protein [Patescibacteria group bacterium]